jgi:oligosaccharide reducing-end xylanase
MTKSFSLALSWLLIATAARAEYDPEFGKGSSWIPAITTWARGQDAAVSITFDDNCQSQFKYAVPALSERGLHGTFFVITDLATSQGKWTAYRNLAAQGHEIGSHSMTHPDLSCMPADGRRRELNRSREVIDSAVPGQKCFSLALPMGWRDRELVEAAKNVYGAVRLVNQWDGLKDNPDLYEVKGMIPYSNTPQADMDLWVSLAMAKKRWLVEIYHGIQDDCWEKVPSERFEAHLDRIVKDKDRLWIAPFGTVARYIRERNLASVSLLSYSDTTLRYSVTDPLSNDVYDVPLTVRVRLPSGWTDFTAEQEGRPIWSDFKWESSMPFALFEAMPDRGPIVLHQGRVAPVAIPKVEIFPKAGIYAQAQMVTLNASGNATILYSLDGKDPLSAGAVYKGPIRLNKSTWLRYAAFGEGGGRSEVSESHYAIDSTAPAVSVLPPEGTYQKPVLVTLETRPGIRLRYTLDGRDPDSASAVYSSAIRITTSSLLKFMVETRPGSMGPTLSQAYQIVPASASATAVPAGGKYKDIQRVVLSAQKGWDIYYTLDGSDPAITTGKRYLDPIWVGKDVTLKFRAWSEFGTTSKLYQEHYAIDAKQGLDIAPLPRSEFGERQGRVTFFVANRGMVRLVLRDLSGREMAKLFEDIAEPLHTYSFAMPSDPLMPGVYFWNVEQNGIPILKKRIVLHR